MSLTQGQFKSRFGELGEFSKKEVDDFFDVLTELVEEVVENADKAIIPGIGTLNCTVRNSRMGRNPATGEAIKIPAKIGVRLGLMSSVKQAVPPLKKGRALVEKREEEKAKAQRKRAKSSAKTGKVGKKVKSGKRGRPKGSTNKKKRSRV